MLGRKDKDSWAQNGGERLLLQLPHGVQAGALFWSLLSLVSASHLGLLLSERGLWDPKTVLQFVSLSLGSVGEIIHCLDSKAMVLSPQSFLLPTKAATK